MATKIEYYKKLFFNGKIDKIGLIRSFKQNFPDFAKLMAAVSRFEREVPGSKGAILRSLQGENPFPKTYALLNRGKVIDYGELEEELNWLTLVFIRSAESISQFLREKDRFEHELLNGRYVSARESIEKIESEFGFSYWSIEHRYILEEYQFGSEKNWEVRNQLLDENNHAFVQTLGHMYSEKAEKRITFFQYNEEYAKWKESDSTGIKQIPYLLEYFAFKANYFSKDQYELFTEIIAIENTASLIDRYLLFVRVIQHLVIQFDNKLGFLTSLLEQVIKHIKDPNLKNLILVGPAVPELDLETVDQRFISLIDLYTNGKYNECIQECRVVLIENCGSAIELLELYTKSLIESKQDFVPITQNESILNEMSRNYYDVLSKTKDTDSGLINIMKLAYTFNNSSIGIQLYSFIRLELNWNTPINYPLLARLSSKFANPAIWENVFKNRGVTVSLLQSLKTIYPNSNAVALFSSLDDIYTKNLQYNWIEAIPERKNRVYEMRAALLQGNISKTVTLCHNVFDDKDGSLIGKHEALIIMYMCHQEQRQYRDCLTIFVDAYVLNSHLTKGCNAKSVILEIVQGKYKGIGDKSSLIDLPIFFAVNSAEKISVKQAYEQFLTANNCRKPSELVLLKDRFPIGKLVLFLKTVCTQDIMQLSKYIESTELANEERIKICQFLVEVDTDNVDVYNAEIVTTTQKNLISKVIGAINERKIYVNDESLRDLISKEERTTSAAKDTAVALNRNSFDRYLNLIDFSVDREYKEFSANIKISDDGLVLDQFVQELVRQKKSERVRQFAIFKVFKDFFVSLRNAFVFNTDYGLDAYLSSKIRHGTLPNHLRSVFETLNLVTSQTGGNYSDNQYWKEWLDLSDVKMKQIQVLLAGFSKSVDESSRALKDDWIQCFTEQRPASTNALFDYSYSDNEINELLYYDFKGIREYDAFIDRIMLELWNRTETNLAIIRETIDTTLKDFYNKIIYTLEDDLMKVIEKNEAPELFHNINLCRTEIQNKLANISNWFRRSESVYDSVYDIETLIETSIQIIKNINPIYKYNTSRDFTINADIKGEYHQHFIEMVNNFLQNMIDHSKLHVQQLNAKVCIRMDSDERITLAFQNSFSDKVDEVDLAQKLNNVKCNWARMDSNVTREKNSGFPKVKRILRADLGRRDSRFHFNIIDKTLVVEISFETNSLV